jgi:hypothetical protein
MIDESQRFYAELQAAVNRAIHSYYPDTIITLFTDSPSALCWYYHDLNDIFNQGTFDYISRRVSPGAVPGTAQLSDAGGFVNAYDRVITSLAFVLGTADQSVLDHAQDSASVQAHSVVSTYQELFGAITAVQLTEAMQALGPFAIANKVDYVIAFVVGYVWSGRQRARKPALSWLEMQRAPDLRALVPDMPASGEPVLAQVQAYLDAVGAAARLQDALNLGGWLRQELLHSTERPDSDNGGMKTVDPSTGVVSDRYQVGYGIDISIADINACLSDASRKITFTYGISNISKAGPGARRALRSLLRVTVDDKEYGIYDEHDGDAKTEITLEYVGFTLIPILPRRWARESGTGWYDDDPIAQACTNTGRDVTGFRFIAPPPYNLGPLAEGGDFGRLRALLISQPPIIIVRAPDGRLGALAERLARGAAGELTLSGALLPGDGQAYALTPAGRAPEKHALTFIPVTTLVSPLERTAHVLGGTFAFAMDVPGPAPAPMPRR